jgi:hypothetical protein
MPSPKDNCSSIDSAMGGGLLIDSWSSSDADNEDSNDKDSTSGIGRLNNNHEILIEKEAEDTCMGVPIGIIEGSVPLGMINDSVPLGIIEGSVPLRIIEGLVPLGIIEGSVSLVIIEGSVPLAIMGSSGPLAIFDGSVLLGIIEGSVPLGIIEGSVPLAIVSNDEFGSKGNNEILLRIQGADLKRHDKYKKRLHLPTAPLWYNCRKCMLKQECIEVGWVSIPSHLLLYTMHLWSCRSYTGSSLI